MRRGMRMFELVYVYDDQEEILVYASDNNNDNENNQGGVHLYATEKEGM